MHRSIHNPYPHDFLSHNMQKLWAEVTFPSAPYAANSQLSPECVEPARQRCIACCLTMKPSRQTVECFKSSAVRTGTPCIAISVFEAWFHTIGNRFALLMLWRRLSFCRRHATSTMCQIWSLHQGRPDVPRWKMAVLIFFNVIIVFDCRFAGWWRIIYVASVCPPVPVGYY